MRKKPQNITVIYTVVYRNDKRRKKNRSRRHEHKKTQNIKSQDIISGISTREVHMLLCVHCA